MSIPRATEATERDQVGCGVGLVLLLSIALIHLLDGVDQVHEHMYVFVLYLFLMAGSLFVAAILLRTDSRLAWSLITLAGGLTLLGFVLSRTSGLPSFRDDIGNWTELSVSHRCSPRQWQCSSARTRSQPRHTSNRAASLRP